MDTQATIRAATMSEVDQLTAIDDDACALFALVGLNLEIGNDHPYALAERACWTRCTIEGNAFLLTRPSGPPIGMVVMNRIDGAPYIEQLSVRRDAMRQGNGHRLLAHAVEWAGGEPLWLTTYAHIPWNRPFYERHGFTVIPESSCIEGVRNVLADQRQVLPAPEQRIAMKRVPS